MRNTITRTITVSTIRTAEITFENGTPKAIEFEPLEFYGKITKDQATKMARKKYGGNPVVMEITETDRFYEITIADFIAHAKEVEKNTETEEE